MRKTMKRGTMLLAGIAAVGLVAGEALAETQKELAEAPAMTTEKPSAEAFVGVYSKYVWRGFELSDDSLVIQPSLTVGYKGFSANFWSNIDTDWDENLNPGVSGDSFNMNETDITLAYDWTMGMAGISAGYIYYDLEGFDDSQEVFLSAGLDTMLNPTLTIYREIAHLPGWYVTFDLSHSIPIKDELALDLGAKVSYWSFDNADDGPDPNNANEEFSDFHDGVLSASMTFPITEYLAVTPELYYSFALSSDASDRLEGASVSGTDDNFIYGGVSATFSF